VLREKRLAPYFSQAATSVFDNVRFFLRRKAEPEARFVVIHDLSQHCESSIMIEAALLVSPEFPPDAQYDSCGLISQLSLRLND
jgi:hypothetical protein